MEIKKLITWVPILAAVLGTLYTGINTIIKLNNTIEQHTLQLREMTNTVAAIDERFTIEVKNLNRAYTEGREEFFREMTSTKSEISSARAKVEALNDSYYKMSNTVEDLKYDLKDFKREVTGDY
jgi:predicted  nucleic acid-binding Zn-ribbon protein|tara:strand:- start:457 stop:828 length:372 start_codon:yes stop_codon:yes gene_type:complete